jgi:cystathionine beta-lyase
MSESHIIYNFDQEIDRFGTSSIKWEFYWDGEDLHQWGRPDPQAEQPRVLPLWVADMDFVSPEPVVEALVKRARHGVFGYTGRAKEYDQAVIDWMHRRHDWEIRSEWISTVPGVVPSVNFLAQAFVKPGQKVIVQTPVYYPFFSAIENNGGEIVRNTLKYAQGRYSIDFADLAQKSADPDAVMMVLCSPHNPVGRVWSESELTQIAQICKENGVLLVSDEVHGDLIFPGNKFFPSGRLPQELSDNLVVCTAPSKTFNLPGLKTANVIISNPDLKARYDEAVLRAGIYGINAFGAEAMIAAYQAGDDWLRQVMVYVSDNYEFLSSYLETHIPAMKPVKPEGTYLVWVDCRALGIAHEKLDRMFFDEIRVYLDDGIMFGEEGLGFMRINIACPRSILAEALDRIRGLLSEAADG